MNSVSSLIPIYVINLRSRTDRKEHIIREFGTKSEFYLTFIDAVEHKTGAVGLWESMKLAIKQAQASNFDYAIICEDDHVFTDSYNRESFESNIDYCIFQDVDILHGGVSFCDFGVQVAPGLFWIKQFRATQFLVVFRSMYTRILNAEFQEIDSADGKLSALADTTLLVYPFVSKQREFGYSDILPAEYRRLESVTTLFDNAEATFRELASVSDFYQLTFEKDGQY